MNNRTIDYNGLKSRGVVTLTPPRRIRLSIPKLYRVFFSRCFEYISIVSIFIYIFLFFIAIAIFELGAFHPSPGVTFCEAETMLLTQMAAATFVLRQTILALLHPVFIVQYRRAAVDGMTVENFAL